MEQEITYQIALTLAKGVGIHTIKKLVNHFGTEEAIFHSSFKELEAVPGIGPAIAKSLKDPQIVKQAEKEVKFLQKTGGETAVLGSNEYPKRLMDCPDAPYVLYTQGEMDMNGSHAIGIVGTRKMTNYGRSLCEEIITDLGQKYPDLTIISGLAYGVDGCAHKKAVEMGLQTIGVIGHGLDTLYPAKHKTLSEKMKRNGGIVTEFRSHCLIDRKNFVSRNRIIAGMSDVVLIVESAEKGGALFTAEFANSYNRDVCAIPGRAGDTYSRGCNNLIKNNLATMVESAEDIERLMNWDVQESNRPAMNITQFMELTDQEKIIVETLQLEEKMEMNQIVRKSQIPFGQLSSILFDMEMKNLVGSAPGNVYFLQRKV